MMKFLRTRLLLYLEKTLPLEESSAALWDPHFFVSVHFQSINFVHLCRHILFSKCQFCSFVISFQIVKHQLYPMPRWVLRKSLARTEFSTPRFVNRWYYCFNPQTSCQPTNHSSFCRELLVLPLDSLLLVPMRLLRFSLLTIYSLHLIRFLNVSNLSWR